MKVKKKNVLFLLIDACEYSMFESDALTKLIVPNIHSLINKGYVRPIHSNGMITQIAMPSILTQTYPFDNGGFDYGIRDREKSVVEILKENGYHTHFVYSHDLTGPQRCYERGFDVLRGLYNHSRIIETYVRLILQSKIKLVEEKLLMKKEVLEYTSKHFDKVLRHAEWPGDSINSFLLPKCLCVPSRKKSLLIRAERELLKKDPSAIYEKLKILPYNMYERYLGQDIRIIEKKRFKRSVKNLTKKINLRNKINLIVRRLFKEGFFLIPNIITAVASEILKSAFDIIKNTKNPWFLMIHLFDVHDGGKTSRHINFLNKLKYMPRLLKIRKQFQSHREPWKDLSLIYVDAQIGKFIKKLKKKNMLQDTLIVVASDHGGGWDYNRGHIGMMSFGFRTYYERIKVPFIISPTKRIPVDKGLYDSMSISATLLDELGIEPHSSFKGCSLYENGKTAAIVENVGRGNCDLSNRNMYFTITTTTHKLMLSVEDKILKPERLFDIKKDPKEYKDLISFKTSKEIVVKLIDELYKYRGEILKKLDVKWQPKEWMEN